MANVEEVEKERREELRKSIERGDTLRFVNLLGSTIEGVVLEIEGDRVLLDKDTITGVTLSQGVLPYYNLAYGKYEVIKKKLVLPIHHIKIAGHDKDKPLSAGNCQVFMDGVLLKGCMAFKIEGDINNREIFSVHLTVMASVEIDGAMAVDMKTLDDRRKAPDGV